MDRLLKAALLMAAISGPLQRASADEVPISTTAHRAQIAGKTIDYTAEAGRVAIRDVATGESHGYMFYTAYRVQQEHGVRPVTFVWNGGPGANSSQLHFFAVGPKRLEEGKFIDNAESWLAFTDLVLVDPIGTGFSRPARREFEAEFYGTLGDVASVSEFVRAWRILHAADASPLWLAGESWGAGRAAEVGYQLEHRGIKVAGMMLISGGWALNEPPISTEMHQALTLVDMATAAVFHGKTKFEPGEDLSAFRERVTKWARRVYAPALSRIDSISSSQRDSIAKQVAGFSGLSLQSVDRKTLSISPRQFRTRLLADKGQQAYLFDLRRTGAPPAAPTAEILSYFRQELKYSTDLPYLGDEEFEVGYAPDSNYPKSVGERWNYATAELPQAQIDAAIAAAVANGGGPPRLGPPLPGSAEAIALDSRIHILVAGGLYDSFLPCATGSEIERSLPKNLKNSMAFRCYVGGHAMYFDAASRHDLARDVNALIEGRWPLPQ